MRSLLFQPQEPLHSARLSATPTILAYAMYIYDTSNPFRDKKRIWESYRHRGKEKADK